MEVINKYLTSPNSSLNSIKNEIIVEAYEDKVTGSLTSFHQLVKNALIYIPTNENFQVTRKYRRIRKITKYDASDAVLNIKLLGIGT